jgi:hypothetical protein
MKIGDLVSIDENLRGKVLKIIAQSSKNRRRTRFYYHFSKDKLTIIDSDLYENSPIIEKRNTKILSKKQQSTVEIRFAF